MTRAKCPVCNALLPIPVGTLPPHRDIRFDGLGNCPGSRKTIAEAQELIAGRRGEAR
jgi:hypothetical protein